MDEHICALCRRDPLKNIEWEVFPFVWADLGPDQRELDFGPDHSYPDTNWAEWDD